jgi:rhamnosyltransferase
MKSDCTIVILSYNGGEILRETLATVLAQSGTVSVEVLVIDSGSNDGSVEFLRSQPVRLVEIPNEEFGHGATRNLGARLAESPMVAFLSQDAVPAHSDWLENLVRPLAETRVAGTYGRQLPRNTHVCERFFLERTYPAEPCRRSAVRGRDFTLRDTFFSNVNAAYKRSVWEKHPLREDLVMSEDQQWAKDVMLDGYEIVYVPDAPVYHSHRYSCGAVFKRYFDSGASLRYILKGRIGDSSGERVRYIVEECRAAKRQESMARIPFVLAYEACRIAGYITGRLEPWLPRRLKIRLSSNWKYWTRR